MANTPERSPDVLSPLPGWLLRAAVAAGCGIVIALAIWLFSAFIVRLTIAIVPVLLALLIAAVFHPLVDRLQHPRMPDWLLPLLVVLALLGSLFGIVALVGTRVASQVPELRQQAEQLSAKIKQQTGIPLPEIPSLHGGSSAGGGGGSAGGVVGAAPEAIGIGTEILVGLFLTLALGFLFLKDGPAMWQWVLDRTGGRVRHRVDVAGRAAWGTLSTYVRGLTIVALFDAAGIALGLTLLGVPLVLTLALLQFFGSYIPTFGAFVAGAIAVAVALVSGGLTTALLTLLLVVAVQQIGNDVIEPWVMGRTLPLHAAVVLVAVTSGAILWGVAGALLFVPLAAAITAAAHALRVAQTDAGTD